jgi:flagellar basal body-associated protein FliL
MKFNRLIYRFLLGLLAVLALVLIVGSIYGLSLRPAAPPQAQTGETGVAPAHIFRGLGQIRVSTLEPQPETAVLFVSFVYDPMDLAFSEELSLRIRDFREITANYIGSFSAAELRNMNEDYIKTELLHRFNALLRLGRIETLYFIDFMII